MTVLETTDRFHTFTGVSFGGVACAQMFVDFYVWEAVLNDNPRLNGIVEIGTFQGGFSLYLHAQAEARGMFFRTYDVIVPERQIPGFVKSDVFAETPQISAHLSRHDPLALFCDGGNKPRELNTFAQHLTPDSVIGVHDWGDEIGEDDVPYWLDMIHQGFCEELGSATRFFRRNDG